MSAIFGMIHLKHQPVAPGDLARMEGALTPHGPDGGGYWLGGTIGLGQRLRYATPQDRFERQPLHSADGRLCLVCAGRLDNRPELIAELRLESLHGEVTDSACMLAAYERWGVECVRHLVGVFTVALWDALARQLLVARSALASPSLFYHATPATLTFATSPKGLFALPGIPRRLDEQQLADYLAKSGTDPALSFYGGVSRLMPGHMLLVQGDQWSVQRFWLPDLQRTLYYASDEAYVEAFIALFTRVVEDNLRSLAPVGVMMSGGLDSTAIAALAAAQYAIAGTELATFTEVPTPDLGVALVGRRYADETPFVQAMAQQYSNLKLNLIPSGRRSYLDGLDEFFQAAEAPFPNASNRPWWEAILQTAAAQGVGNLLTGNGGNLTMSWQGDGLLAELVGAARWGQAWKEARMQAQYSHAQGAARILLSRGIMPYLPGALYLAADRLRSLTAGVRPQADWRRYSPIHPQFAQEHHVEERARAKGRHLRFQPKLDTRPVRLNGLLSSVKRGEGLGEGYRARFGTATCDPAMDVRLVEFCLALPEAQCQRDGVTRWLLRRAMAERLPAAVLDNPRRGLQAANWYENLRLARPQLIAALDHMAQNDLARRALDLPRLRGLVEAMSDKPSDADRQAIEYRGVLERGLMTGCFICWVEEGRR